MKFLRLVLLLLCLILAHQALLARSQEDLEDDDEMDEVLQAGQADVPEGEAPPLVFQNTPQKSSSYFKMPEFKLEDYTYEAGILIFFAFYGVNFLVGRKKNADIVKAWVKANWALFERNFSYFGDGKGNSLIKDGESDYIFYASGRINCKSLTAKFELRKRHDLVGMLMEFVFPVYDKLTIDVVLSDSAPGFVFAIHPKKKMAALKAEQYDLKNFTLLFETNLGLPEHLVVAADCKELIEMLLKRHSLSPVITKNAEWFESLSFSDQPRTKPSASDKKHPKTLSFTFRLPPVHQMHQTVALQEMVVFYIDYIAESVNLSSEAASKINKHRSEAKRELQKELQEQKKEELQKEKEEEQRKERERVEKMSPEQQRKWEADNYKKELKKKQAARVKFMRA